MTLYAFYAAVEAYHKQHPQQRYGQALFNVLEEHKPELANQIRGTDKDPFHATVTRHTDRVGAAKTFIAENWYGKQ